MLHPTFRMVLAFFQSVTSFDEAPCWPDSASAGEKPLPSPISIPRWGFSCPLSSLGRKVVSESTAVWMAMDLGNTLQADGLVAFVGPFVRLDQNHAPVANRALQMAVALAVAIVERIPHPLLRFGMRLRRCEPAVGRGHAGGACKAQRACSSAGRLQKAPAREPAARAASS